MKMPTDHSGASIELNLTSMIDVIFLLLIFFVCTTSFKEPEKLLPTNLNTPGSIESEETPPQEERDLGMVVVKITFDQGGNLVFIVDGKRLESLQEVEELLASLQKIDSDVPVVVQPDPEIALESVLNVYDSARRVGLFNVKFAVEPETLSM